MAINISSIPYFTFLNKDDRLNPTARLLVCLIYYLSCKQSYCYASDQTLANVMVVSRSTIVKNIKLLKDCNYIYSEYDDDYTRQRRYIYLCDGELKDRLDKKIDAGEFFP